MRSRTRNRRRARNHGNLDGLEIPLGAQAVFTQFGVTRAGRVVGISHDVPMRYDLELEDGALMVGCLLGTGCSTSGWLLRNHLGVNPGAAW